MKYVYGIMLLLIWLELCSIRSFLGIIAEAYREWSKSIEKEDNPIITVEAEDD